MPSQKISYLDMLDNDYNIIANRFFDDNNIIRKANLSTAQAIQSAKWMVTEEVLQGLPYICPYCKSIVACHVCGKPKPKYLYEANVYNHFTEKVHHLSLSSNGKAFDTVAKTISETLRFDGKSKKEEKEMKSE